MTKPYTEEFKCDAVRLAETSGKAKVQVARELGVSETVLYRWIKDYGAYQASSLPGNGPTVNYKMISDHQAEYAVETMCRALQVSMSGYYTWRTRATSQHAQEDADLLAEIRTIHQVSRKLYGSPRIHAALAQAGFQVSRKRVIRLMREAGLHSQRRVRRRIRTTDSAHHRPVAPNLLTRDFSASAPNHK